MKHRWKRVYFALGLLFAAACLSAFGLGIYFGERMPTTSDPTIGRTHTHVYHSKVVYLTVCENTALLASWVLAALSFLGMFLVDRLRDPFSRHGSAGSESPPPVGDPRTKTVGGQKEDVR